MAGHPITLEVPEEMYERLERTARGMQAPVQQTLLRIVEARLPSLADVPLDYRPDLLSLEELDDDALWSVARSRMAPRRGRQLSRLLASQ